MSSGRKNWALPEERGPGPGNRPGNADSRISGTEGDKVMTTGRCRVRAGPPVDDLVRRAHRATSRHGTHSSSGTPRWSGPPAAATSSAAPTPTTSAQSVWLRLVDQLETARNPATIASCHAATTRGNAARPGAPSTRPGQPGRSWTLRTSRRSRLRRPTMNWSKPSATRLCAKPSRTCRHAASSCSACSSKTLPSRAAVSARRLNLGPASSPALPGVGLYPKGGA